MSMRQTELLPSLKEDRSGDALPYSAGFCVDNTASAIAQAAAT